MVIFYSYVSLPEGIYPSIILGGRNWWNILNVKMFFRAGWNPNKRYIQDHTGVALRSEDVFVYAYNCIHIQSDACWKDVSWRSRKEKILTQPNQIKTYKQ